MLTENFVDTRFSLYIEVLYGMLYDFMWYVLLHLHQKKSVIKWALCNGGGGGIAKFRPNGKASGGSGALRPRFPGGILLLFGYL